MKGRYVFLVAMSLALIAADQGTKWWAATTLAERRIERARPACDEEGPIARRARYRPARQIHVVEGFFSFRYVENCAGAFGILSDQDESVRRPFFLAVTVAAIIFIVMLFRRLGPEQRLLAWALPFVLGGALGNLVDRIHLRYVIDFIDMYHASIGRWPTYNIADMAIVVGVGLILLDMLPFKKAEPQPLEHLDKKKKTSLSTGENDIDDEVAPGEPLDTAEDSVVLGSDDEKTESSDDEQPESEPEVETETEPELETETETETEPEPETETETETEPEPETETETETESESKTAEEESEPTPRTKGDE